MDLEAEVVDTAPVEVDPGESFERDYSDLDIPGFEAEDAPPAANKAAEQVEAETEEPAVQEVDAKAKALADAKVAAGSAEPKKLAFKHGDTAVELLEDAKIEWKVDGKPTPVAVKDLLQNYSGKVAWEKRFNEVAEQRKQFAEVSRSFEAERTRHSSAISEMHKAASEGRTFDAVSAMLRLTNTQANPREYVKQLRDGLIKQAEELAKMTPEQRQLYEEREENAYLKSAGKLVEQQREQEQAERSFQDRVVKAIKSVNSTTEEYVNTLEWLKANGQQVLGKEWNQETMLTPEFIANQIRDTRDYGVAKEALIAVDPALVQNQAIWKQAVEFLRSNPDWTAEDLKEVYKQATSDKRSETLSRKVAKAPTGTTARASTAKGKKDKREDFTVFDEADLEW